MHALYFLRLYALDLRLALAVLRPRTLWSGARPFLLGLGFESGSDAGSIGVADEEHLQCITPYARLVAFPAECACDPDKSFLVLPGEALKRIPAAFAAFAPPRFN
jgi:hypothetical protein